MNYEEKLLARRQAREQEKLEKFKQELADYFEYREEPMPPQHELEYNPKVTHSYISKRDFTTLLKKMKEKYNFDFVRSDMGHCCQSCADFKSEKIYQEYTDAETYLIITHFVSGGNYRGPIENQFALNLRWGFNEEQNIVEVCNDLQEALKGYYYVKVPKDTSETILLLNLNPNFRNM